ncbi:MAG: Crp/Fnr family transcriptional regulator [Rhodocyclaceae bacterium]|nr:Crp/Fnr family transcriptional regulator [Rhodocyclaceae bacterium]MBX3676294.1 Crp/Fnr family transcriptional regulator [Rhodocyclaceae bacterium]MCB1891392.1 Crp/Fnr family transcriptional regulator [Rhodocyclaceae bacterium]MCW5595933.1 Crp/Fnr family transcriptional regulator [Rhodocyclaceae bacterium]
MLKLGDMLRASLWSRSLTSDQLRRVESEIITRQISAGGFVCRKGEPVEHWIGVVEGLVKMTNLSADGKPTTFTGLPTGGWFGEGSLFKDEPRRYDVVALRNSSVAYMPKATFVRLLDTSIEFNRFLLIQLNERLGQFIAMVEHDRLLEPDARVARSLAAMFNPYLYPGIGPQLQISQEEIGYLAGLSRQRANQALKTLEKAGLLRIEYGGITVLDLDGLRNFGA